MAITFQKRQKEMKRMEKQRAKAERRAQKKQAKRDNPDSSGPPVEWSQETSGENETAPPFDQGTP
jgi:hypothetical protein